MTVLSDYRHFGGRHWETGTVHNFYAYRGVKAPHTGLPYSEALLLGVSGGITMGYFTFAYEGYDPQCNILTRNTFDPLNTLLSRLGVVQHLEQTAKADKAESILLDTLEEGLPAIVWADMWSLPYNALRYDPNMWGTMPILVYGFDRETNQVLIADRSSVSLTVSVDELAAARGRVKKEKHRLLTLDIPNPDKLESAVRMGLSDCLKLFTEKPPKGAAHNFGLAAYQFWADMLTNPKGRLSWARIFPPGLPMYAGLLDSFKFPFLFGKGLDGDAERGLYAAFLDEAAVIIANPALHEVARHFRASSEAWRKLPTVLLPDHIPPLARARQLAWRRHECFLQQGLAGLDEIRAIDEERVTIRQSMVNDFPLTESESVHLREQIAEQVLMIRQAEQHATEALREALT